ncbi:Non-reducing polyketide synthase terA [Colletotrichum spinosum]|uniref:Non-reducing polyketide synthase terA n=1 Tax=Colletotrichum spinosum TaxID=1347390 RepID=A0A4R8QHA8_9PEZI|nr:Non-reducing polyketide synthase terA [Colletotrichum spinosum]
MASDQLLFFGDQTVETGPFLRDLSQKAKSSRNLQKFLLDAGNNLRTHVSTLEGGVRKLIPEFHTVAELAEARSDPAAQAILSPVLLCIAQLGDLIHRAEKTPSLLQSSSDGPGPARHLSTFAHRHIYVSSESRSTLTLSGPPSVLQSFLSSTAMYGVRSTSLPIYTAFHASHLAAPDVGAIIGTSPVFTARIPQGTTLFSPTTGSAYDGETLYEFLRQALHDIFQEKLLPSKTLDSALHRSSGSKLSVHVFGPSNAGGFLDKSLAASGFKDAKVQLSETAETGEPQDAIAIVGMSGRFPGGDNLQAFWDILVQGKDLHKKVPKDRFDVDLHCDPTGKTPNSTLSAFGCFLDKPGYFDNLMFNMSPREAAQTDPCQRLLLMAAYEALETAGYRYDAKPDRGNVGSFVGLTTDDWREYNISQEIDMYFVTGGLRSFGSGRLNYFFKLEGPSYVLDTACSSSAASIELACASLLGRDCDMALAGGANVMTGPNLWAGLSRAGFVSPTGSCKTFDETADGYCRGEGVGIIVLKRLEDAIQAGDNIQGVIRGIATNHSANALSITQPHGPTQKKLYNQVLRKANLTPDQIQYVEMHGTGTQAGDVTEMNSVVSTFASGREPTNPLYVGGIKANVGHGEAAAGVTSVIKALMMFRENAIPPHAGIKTRINSKFPPLEKANIHIARELKPFMTDKEPRRIMIGNFGATGGNTCMVIEEPPPRSVIGKDPRNVQVVTVSAKTRSSLRGNKQRLLDHLVRYPDLGLENIAYTLTARRSHQPLRSSFCASSVQGLVKALSSDLGRTADVVNSVGQGSIVFVFPGQGVKFFGLAKNLYGSCPQLQQSILELNNMARTLGLPPFIDLILREQSNGASPTRTHLAIVALEIAIAQLLKSWGIVPNAVLGHSLGEYAALCTAGVLTVADTLLLVGRRAQLVEKLCVKDTHGMLAISAPARKIQTLIDETPGAAGIAIACFNSPVSVVVNGNMEALERFRTTLREGHSIKSTYLSTPYAFHSAQLDPMLDAYQTVAESAQFCKPSIPVVSTLLGRVVDKEGVFTASYLAEQTRKPVRFETAITAARDAGYVTNNTLIVEAGPGAMCLSMAKSTLAGPCKLLPALQSASSTWEALSQIVADAYTSGVSVDWAEFHRPYKPSLSVLDLPTYHFDLKDFWIQYRGGVAALERDVKAKSLQGSQSPGQASLGTCLHRLESEDVAKDSGTVEFSVDLQEPSLRKLIDGHNVVGIALTPSGVYQEMAWSAARYLHGRMSPGGSDAQMVLQKLDIFSPLFLAQSTGPQMVTVRATTKTGSNTFVVTVSSDKDHSRCELVVAPAHQTQEDEWKARRARVAPRSAELLQPASQRPVYRLFRQMVYKIFSPITDYSSEYWSINEVFIDQSFTEAAFKLDLRETPAGSSFTYDPCWLDSIAQTAGFLLNSNASNPADVVYMSTGCDALKLSNELTGGRQYLCYVRAEMSDNGSSAVCETTVFDETGAVAIGEGLKFKRVKKARLRQLLGLPLATQSDPVKNKAAPPEQKTAVEKGVKQPRVTSDAADKPTANVSVSRLQTLDHEQLSAVLKVISAEVGTQLEDVEKHTTLEDLGVDSLLTVAITSRLKSEQNIELPATLIAGPTTIAELVAYFDDSTADVVVDEPTDESGASTQDSPSSAISTPPTLPVADSPISGIPGLEGVDMKDILLSVIAKESGLDPSEIGMDTSLADIGVDSLMSIAIIGAVKEQTGTELPASLLADCATVSQVVRTIASDSSQDDSALFPSEELLPQVVLPPVKPFNPEEYHSNVVLLQGQPQSQQRLFLITDGSGSAAVYLHLPKLAPNLTVYALEAPFLGRASEFTGSMEQIGSIYARAIRSVQPRGPYMIGGFSVGGMFAYETLRQLVEGGERIHSFLVFDAACPKKLQGIPDVTVEVCEMTGIFDSISETDKRRPLTLEQKTYVAGCVKCVMNYDPVPLPAHARPAHTFIIWARNGFFDKLSDKVIEADKILTAKSGLQKEANPDWMEWLTVERSSFGPRGWDRLVGDVETFVVDGDHFSIMMRPRITNETGPLVQKLAKKMVSTLNKPQQLTQAAESPAALQRIRDTFKNSTNLVLGFSDEAGCSGFWDDVFPAQQQLVLAFVTESLARMGCDPDALAPGEALEITNALPRHQNLLQIIYKILQDGGLVESRHGRFLRTRQPVDKTPSWAVYNQLVRDHPLHNSEHELLQVAGSKLAECLTGAVEPLSLIFGKSRGLLQDFYTNAPMFVAASKFACEIIGRAFAGAASRVEILEVGAGLGGTTKYVLDKLVDEAVPFTYTYTDISSSFLAEAKKRYAHLPPGSVEFVPLDVEKTPPERLRGRFHAVLSSNCVHATRSLAASCGNIRRLLRPGGFVVLVEFTTRLSWLDLVFGLLEGWWRFDDGRTHCLADERLWESTLKAVGFENVLWSDAEGNDKPNPQTLVAF